MSHHTQRKRSLLEYECLPFSIGEGFELLGGEMLDYVEETPVDSSAVSLPGQQGIDTILTSLKVILFLGTCVPH